MGCAVLPHLKSLSRIIEHGLSNENQKVRTITALSLAALAEAAAPYGIESFDSVLKPLWKGINCRSFEGYRECDWYDQDDTAYQGSSSSADPRLEE